MLSALVSPSQVAIAPASHVVEVVDISRHKPVSVGQMMENISLQEAVVATAKRQRDQWKHASAGSHRDKHREAFAKADTHYHREIGTLHTMRRQLELIPQ